MRCEGCSHLEHGRCELTECIYVSISQRDLLFKGTRISKGIWEYNGKTYKSIDLKCGCFICIEIDPINFIKE